MNDRLQLFFDNIEKINLYFGADADKFSKDLALKLTVRNIRFYYEDYEKVQQRIKTNTKWYQFVSMNLPISHAYYVHFAKTPEQIPHALHMYKILTKKFNRGEQCYLASLHIRSDEQTKKIERLIDELIKQPSLKFSSFSTNNCAILAARPEQPAELASSFEKYYRELVSIGFDRNGETKNSAFLLTVGTGVFCDKTFDNVKILTKFIQHTDTKIKHFHYKTIVLLALAKFDISQFPALYDIHDEICHKLKIRTNSCNSLLLATQIYTSNEAIGDLSSYELDFSDFMYAAVTDSFDGNNSTSDDGSSD